MDMKLRYQHAYEIKWVSIENLDLYPLPLIPLLNLFSLKFDFYCSIKAVTSVILCRLKSCISRSQSTMHSFPVTHM